MKITTANTTNSKKALERYRTDLMAMLFLCDIGPRKWMRMTIKQRIEFTENSGDNCSLDRELSDQQLHYVFAQIDLSLRQ